jgi:YegS/Rv2252/BmrU family lipid kinase
MKTLVILNPAAGHGRGEQRWQAGGDPVLEVVRTKAPGHASELAREAAGKYDALVAAGGDGTLGEVVDGYLSASEKRAALATWPIGSGCDLARHIGMRATREDLSAALSSRPRRLDAGLVEYKQGRRYFLNIAALGLAGDVALRVQASGKPFGGTLTYLLQSLAALATARPKPMDFVVDGVEMLRADCHLAVLANTSTFGGGMRVAPTASAEDGLLDMVTVGALSRPQLLRRFPSIYTGGHLGTEGVEHRLAKRVEVSSPETVYLNIDGDAIGTLPAAFSVLPGAVPFFCPSI